MDNQEETGDQIIFFYERFLTETDSGILKILRNNKEYQPAAVNAAVRIAIERKIIHSEQDLLAPEYQKVEALHFTFFPKNSNSYFHKQLINSIFRVLMLLALLPLIFGVLNYATGNFDLALEGIGLGILWAVLCSVYRKGRYLTALVSLFLILVIFLIFGVIRLMNLETLKVFDIVVLIIGIIMPAYLLLYLKKLLSDKPTDK